MSDDPRVLEAQRRLDNDPEYWRLSEQLGEVLVGLHRRVEAAVQRPVPFVAFAANVIRGIEKWHARQAREEKGKRVVDLSKVRK